MNDFKIDELVIEEICDDLKYMMLDLLANNNNKNYDEVISELRLIGNMADLIIGKT